MIGFYTGVCGGDLGARASSTREGGYIISAMELQLLTCLFHGMLTRFGCMLAGLSRNSFHSRSSGNLTASSTPLDWIRMHFDAASLQCIFRYVLARIAW